MQILGKPARSVVFCAVLSVVLSMLPVLPAFAKKRACTGAEMALTFNLKQQSFTVEVLLEDDEARWASLRNRYVEFTTFGDRNSGTAISMKNELDLLQESITKNRGRVRSFDTQVRSIFAKCSAVSLEKVQSAPGRKDCTKSEIRALDAVIRNFSDIQSKKRNWDGKRRVAQAFANDFTKLDSIRATAMLDLRKYTTYYEIELGKEAFAEQQFDFLNGSCKNSGRSLPQPYQPPVPPPTPDPTTSVYVDDFRLIYNALQGGFTVQRQSDGSVVVGCADGVNYPYPKFRYPEGVSLQDSRLLLVGSREKFDAIYTAYTLDVYRARNFIGPTDRFKVIGSKFGRDSQYMRAAESLVGKFVSFTNSGSMCGIITEPLLDLKKSFASDAVSVGLFLILKTSNTANRIWPGDQVAILLGAVSVD